MCISNVYKSLKTERLSIIISAIATFFFNAPSSIYETIISSIIILFFAILVIEFSEKRVHYNSPDVKIKLFIIVILASVLALFSETFHEEYSGLLLFDYLASIFRVSDSLIALIVTATMCICSSLFLYRIIEMGSIILDNYRHNEKWIKKTQYGDSFNKKAFLISFFSSMVIITICSQSSFLYPLNEWCDANCFFTVGKSIASGLVPYRDLLEQKGPLLYFIHTFAWLISKDTFIGIYLIEIIAATFFLYFNYLSFELLANCRYYLVIPIIATVTYTSTAFQMGDSAEELCLCFLAYAIWTSLKTLLREEQISLKEYFIIGLTAGCVFWIKFTLLGIYLGWFIIPSLQLIKNKQWCYLKKSLIMIILGVVVSTIPWIIYFSLNKAVVDLLKVYIYDNIFSYTVASGNSFIKNIILNLIRGGGSAYGGGKTLLLCILGLILLPLTKWKKIGYHLFFMECFAFLFVYIGGRHYLYYSLIFYVFIVFGVFVIYKMLENVIGDNGIMLSNNNCSIITIFVLTGILSICITPNRPLMCVEKDQLPQYQFNEIIKTKETPTLLNYGFLDGGFYTVSNIVPTCKSFCKLNLPLIELEEMQDYYVNNGLIDFIVTRDQELNTEIYNCIKECDYFYEGKVRKYRLYEKIE